MIYIFQNCTLSLFRQFLNDPLCYVIKHTGITLSMKNIYVFLSWNITYMLPKFSSRNCKRIFKISTICGYVIYNHDTSSPEKVINQVGSKTVRLITYRLLPFLIAWDCLRFPKDIKNNKIPEITQIFYFITSLYW